MKKQGFPFPMTSVEAAIGWVYIFVHVFALGLVLQLLNNTLFPALGFTLTASRLTLLYFCVSFVFILAFLFRFLGASFRLLGSNLGDTLIAVLAGYFAYMLLAYLVALALGLTGLGARPGALTIYSAMKLNPGVMLIIAVFLAPVVEETLFRGVVFGTLRKRSRVLAYVISALFFAVYHIWESMLAGLSWRLLVELVRYIPAGVVLAWAYEKGKNVYAPTLLHILINIMTVTVTFGV